MIHYIVRDSLNTERLSVKTNKSVFNRVTQNGILLICLEVLRSALLSLHCLRILVLNAKLPLYHLLLHFRVSIEATMRVSKSLPSVIWGTSSKLGISTKSGILSQLCSTIFIINASNAFYERSKNNADPSICRKNPKQLFISKFFLHSFQLWHKSEK